jgi:hypothetical protein
LKQRYKTKTYNTPEEKAEHRQKSLSYLSAEQVRYKEEFGKWLQPIPWSYWATPTTGYELTLPSARRAMHRLHNALDKHSPCTMVWVAEPFDTKTGYHTHALIQTDLPFKAVVDTWQQVSGNTKFQRGEKWNRIQLEDYDQSKGAAYYIGKYMSKKLSDFDFLTSGCSRGYMSTYKRK